MNDKAVAPDQEVGGGSPEQGQVEPSDAELAIWEQLNEHLRSTEQKQITISGAFIALVALMISGVYGSRFELLSTPDGANIVTSALILLVGLPVFVLQAWYRSWKVHYMHVCREIVKRWSIDATVLPDWLKPDEQRVFFETPGKESWLKPDNTMTYLTAALNLAAAAYLGWNLFRIHDNNLAAIVGAVAIVAATLGFQWWIKVRFQKLTDAD